MRYQVFLCAVLFFWQTANGQPMEWVVAQDGSGDFEQVQEAIDAVPNLRRARTVIRIKPGIYKEKLVLPDSKTNVSLIGEDAANTVITYDDYARKKNGFGEEIGTSGSSSFFIFGDGFQAENITFENSAGPVGQAVAVRVAATQVAFRGCRFLGNQDTLYPQGAGTKQYYYDCYIEGTTDFIFGAATAVFDNCTIFSKAGASYITAASTPDTCAFGFVFLDCTLRGDADDASVYLGRPWRPYAKTAFIDCDYDALVHPAGWHNWGRPSNEYTASYVEYGNTGPGANTDNRVGWSEVLTADARARYTVDYILGGWNPKQDIHN
ncbi:pectinesterase family protein [Parapedobacter soli]|uniref:pectinesterase family protein n=1 Tax=Parapedobacter soli TaxID=416955 RepID=UPI0021C924B4|nr:pectinesterase family protein [Parapedobacter soli]